MPWENLEEDILEELSDLRRSRQDLLRTINRNLDKESHNFNCRWYYRKNKAKILEQKRKWRADNPEVVAAYERRNYEKRREAKKLYAKQRRERLRQTEEGRRILREESKRARQNGSTERYREKLKQDPARLEKLRAAHKLSAKKWREKKAEKWQSAHQSSLKVNGQQSVAASGSQKEPNT